MLLNQCINNINSFMLIRIILTTITIFLIFINVDIPIIENSIYLILPIVLTVLDSTDNIHSYLLPKDSSCSKSFDYQLKDKLVDLLTYVFAYFILGLDPNILYLIIYRTIGVVLFYLTKKSYWLVLFFDFIKEYMLYVYIFKHNYKYLPIMASIKIAFEYYFHSYHNMKTY